MSFRRIVCFVCTTTLFTAMLSGAPLRNVPQILVQPGGDTLHCLASGDEFYHWLHDAENFTIVEDPASGFFVYAVIEDGRLVPSRHIAGRVDPRSVGLVPGLNVIPERAFQLRKERNASIMNVSAPQQGAMNNLIVFIRFSGESEFPDSLAVYNRQHNDSTPGVNSMINYFREVSYNKLTVRSSMYPLSSGAMVTSFQDSHPRSYFRPYNATTNPDGYTSDNEARLREHALLRDAVNAISSQVPAGINIDADNDGLVDNVCFIVSGSPDGWSDLLWPHMWALYTYNVSINGKRVYEYNLQLRSRLVPSGVGVLCHELAHTIGFPDLYRYVDNTIDPVSSWDLMCADRNPPQHVVAYQKMRYGTWIDSIPLITTTGVYTLNPITASTNNCYRIASPNSATEYFVVEYRKKEGRFENSVPGSGLLVYRVNTAVSGQGNANGPPDEVYIYRPGGTLTVNGNPSYANFNEYVGRTRINDATSPSSFLSTGGPGGLDIRNIGIPGSTISFKVTMLEPLIEFTRDTLEFGTIGLGATRVDTLTMTNPGRESLFVSSIVSPDPNFLVSPSNAVLAPSGTGVVTVTYTPAAAGTHVGSIVFSHNASGSPDTVVVNGTCENPTPSVTLSHASVAFGIVLVDSLKTDSVVVSNPGTGVLNVTSVTTDNSLFGVTPASFSLQPSASRTMLLTFQPDSAGVFTGSIVLVHDAAGSPDTIAVSGTGVVPAPLFTAEPISVDFGIVPVNASKLDTIVITNNGNAPLTVTSALVNNPLFAISPGADTIAPSGAGLFIVRFEPLTGGPVSGTVVFTHDAAGSPDTAQLTGIGAQAEFSAAVPDIDFGEVLVGSTKLRTLAISNPGYAELVISSAATDNDRFTITPNSVTVGALSGRIFQVRFIPDTDVVESANLVFVHNAAGLADTVRLTGTGAIPRPGFSPSSTSVDVGNVDVGAPEADSILVTNDGTLSLQIDSVISANPAFSVLPPGATLDPSESQWFRVTFSPAEMGPASGTLVFYHNAPGLADTIPVLGTGVRRLGIQPRWNMVSVPVGLAGMMASDVFPTSTSAAFGWGPAGYTQKDTLATGPGYWMKFESAQNVDLIGIAMQSATIDVIEGWNMIGSITPPVSAASLSTAGTNIVSPVFGYDGGYSIADSIRPGKGYWLRVDQAGQLIVGLPPLTAGPQACTVPLSDGARYSVLTIRDAVGSSQSLYIDHIPSVECDFVGSNLPPPPPQGGFDVSFSGRMLIEEMSKSGSCTFVVNIAGAVYPLTFEWDPASGASPVTFMNGMETGNSPSVTLQESGSFTLEDASVKAVRLNFGGTSGLPGSVQLDQNYPNPFNPSTVIGYSLPAPGAGTQTGGRVTLKVYNMIGQHVATLVDEVAEAGSWTVRFDARNLPSGLYSYVLQAGEMRLAKTMLLVK